MALTVSASFTKNTGDPATGLTLSEIGLYLYSENKATGAIATIWNGTQNPTAEISNIGVYVRQYGSEDFDTYNYYAGAHYTGATALDVEWVIGAHSEIAGFATAAALADVHTDIAALSLAWSGAAIAASVASGVISQIRGDVWNIALTGLAANTGYSAIDFSIKKKDSDTDDAALVHIRLSAPPVAADGLLRLNGADPSDLTAGYITVVSATAITIHLDADKTAALAALAGLVYDVQYLFTGTTGPTTVEKGIFTVTADVSRATA